LGGIEVGTSTQPSNPQHDPAQLMNIIRIKKKEQQEKNKKNDQKVKT
jgi:hypothetical protein